VRYIKYVVAGIFFGIIMVKSEAISWYRIYEMFQFDSFHMYGIIGSAVSLGMLGTFLMKKRRSKSIYGDEIEFVPKNMSITRYLVGGILFGLGWALVGACPGPMFVLLGTGLFSIIVVIIGALAGTFVYGLLRNRLPH